MEKKFVVWYGKGLSREFVAEYDGWKSFYCPTTNGAEKFTEERAKKVVEELTGIYDGDKEFGFALA
jgi:hypothetical protein